MRFGKRGVDPSSRAAVPRDRGSCAAEALPPFRAATSAGAAASRSQDLLYPVACLALGLVLGGALGAVLAPQLLQAADDAGIYDFIRQNAAREAAKERRRPLPEFHVRLSPSGRPDLMRARLPPQQRRAEPAPQTAAAPEAPRFSSALEAILNDATLRGGDTVIMKTGAMVFRGGKRLPHSLDDFTDFRESTLLTKGERKLIDNTLGLSRSAETMRLFLAGSRTAKASADFGKPRTVQANLPAPIRSIETVR